MTRKTLAAAILFASAVSATYARYGYASDHDDGEADLKGRALNLTDHYAFKSGSDLSLVMYVNPRSLPGRQYYLSTNARYEFHVSKAASKTAAPTGTNDYVFRFEAAAPNPAGVQMLTLTVLKDGQVLGTHTGTSTSFLGSANNSAITTNSGSAGTMPVKYFVGQRADSFHFDVNRFFQVRTFLATRFFGGPGGIGDSNAALANNCRGDSFLQGVLSTETNPDADPVNLFNPPSCAPDFTKNLNVTAIVLDVPIAMLGGGTVFDTWSTISVLQ